MTDITALGYQTTTVADVAIRDLDSRDGDSGFRGGVLYCACKLVATSVVRYVPTGFRELSCGEPWHRDLAAFVDRAKANTAYWGKLRAQDAAYIAAHPEDTVYAAAAEEMWAAHVVCPGIPQ